LRRNQRLGDSRADRRWRHRPVGVAGQARIRAAFDHERAIDDLARRFGL
jgi:hypothetical protein